MLLKCCTGKTQRKFQVKWGVFTYAAPVSSMYLLEVTVIGCSHCTNDCLWFPSHQTYLETYLGFVSYNLSLTVLRLVTAASFFPFPSFMSIFLEESTYNSAIFFKYSLLCVIEQKPLSPLACSVHELSLRDILLVFLGITISSSPLMQGLSSSYLSSYCGFTLGCSYTPVQMLYSEGCQ